ncbi:hypothetical protein GCM10007086_33880 [Photobacterium aphoticum]|nr:hypothetical protein GCM10007086_33880 [Photobacterium aphoticum]
MCWAVCLNALSRSKTSQKPNVYTDQRVLRDESLESRNSKLETRNSKREPEAGSPDAARFFYRYFAKERIRSASKKEKER